MMKYFGLYILMIGLLFGIPFISTDAVFVSHPETNVKIFEYQDDFKAIETDEISDVVKQTVEKEYPSAGIAEAFKDPLGNYKLILVMDQETKVVYLDPNGNWYSPEEQG